MKITIYRSLKDKKLKAGYENPYIYPKDIGEIIGRFDEKQFRPLLSQPKGELKR